MKKLYVIGFISLALLMVSRCAQQAAQEDTVTAGHSIDTTAFVDRATMVMECAACHKDEYENWKIGPHAHAYVNLEQHLKDIQNPELFPPEYAVLVGENYNTCLNCHASKNLYENNFAGLEAEDNPLRFTTEHYPALFSLASARPENDDRSTGIDCMTCHVVGNKVVANADFVAKGGMPDCNPIASKFFSTNHNCVSCHFFEQKAIDENLALGYTGEIDCVKCHQEYDASGKGTHFFFWRHDDESGKQRPLPYSGIFNDAILAFNNSGNLQFTWENKVNPHRFSECGEVVYNIRVHDNAGRLVLDTAERLNRKIYHDEEMKHLFADGRVPGVEGYTFDMFAEPLNKEYPVPAKAAMPLTVSVTGIVKAQYWASDKIAKEVYSHAYQVSDQVN